MVKRTNKALALVRLIGSKPDTYTFHEACAVVGMNAGYRYLIDTGYRLLPQICEICP